MRSTLLLLAFALALISCNVNIQTSDAPFTLDSLMTYDYKGLEKLFGAEKLKDSLAYDPDGKSIRYTLVMPGTKAAVRLQWVDTSRISIDYATISGTASSWKTRDSVTLGISLSQLEKINEVPFFFFYDAPKELDGKYLKGRIMTWSTGAPYGKLSTRISDLKLNVSTKLPSNGDQSGIISSNSPMAIENNPIVIEVTISRMNIPLKILIEDVIVTRTANIPHATSNRVDDRVDKINKVILEYFDLKSFNPQPDFAWSDIRFETEMDDNTIAIHLKGSYMGAYPTDIDDVLFIDKSGYKMDKVDIPFYTLFNHDSYFNFLNKYWSEKCDAAMSEAMQCANQAPSCSCYDMTVSSSNQNIIISTIGDCYPHAAEACNPKATAQIPATELTPYLSDFGKKIVLESNYFNKSALKQFNIANEYRNNLPNVMFIRFDIVNAIDDSQADQAVLGLQLIPGDDPFSGKIEGWFKYLNIDEEPLLMVGEFAESGNFSVKDPTGNMPGEFSFRWAAPGEDPYNSNSRPYVEGSNPFDGVRFEIIKALYSGFPFYEPRGD